MGHPPCVSLRLPRPPYAERRGEVLNHDCHDEGKIAMIFPSRPLWIPACAGMTCGCIPLAPYAVRRGEIPRCARNDMV